MELLRRFGPRLRSNEILAPYTWFGIGGPADYFLEFTTREDLLSALDAARHDGLPVFLLGGGSNLLVSDRGMEGLVLRNRWQEIRPQGDELLVAAGTPVRALVQYALDQGDRAGFEFLAGLPGTVGGAVCGNAGAYGQSIADLLRELTLVSPTGELKRCRPESLDFSYRESRLKQSGEFVVNVRLYLPPGNGAEAARLVRQYLDNRTQKHPGRPLGCAGSYFKNPPGPPGDRRTAAGWLLEQVGAKEFQVGDAGVFERHANMIVNRGTATAADVLALAARMKRAVAERFAIQLEEEVRFVGRPLDPSPAD